MEAKKLGGGEPSPPLGTCNYWRNEHVEGSHDMCLGWAKSANNAETLARWMWANFVGIPITEPYDKEYIALHDRIEKLQREWFVKGLSEARRQFGRSGAAQEVSPPSPEPVCPMCCKPVFTDGYEGDTRELKAALSQARAMLYIASRKLLPESKKLVQEFLDETKSLLG